jgi:hypothetical protein
MSDGKLYYGSLCLTDLVNEAKKAHSSFSRSEKNGKIYCNIHIWVNEEPGKFGNHVSVQLQSKKESAEREGRVYIANAKLSEKDKPLGGADAEQIGEMIDDLPF